MCAHTWAHTHIQLKYTCVHRCTYMHTHLYADTLGHKYEHMCTHAHIDIVTHKHLSTGQLLNPRCFVFFRETESIVICGWGCGEQGLPTCASHTQGEILIFPCSAAASLLTWEFLETWPLQRAELIMPGECVRETTIPTGPLVQMPMWIFLTSGSVKGLTSFIRHATYRGGCVQVCPDSTHRRVGLAIV